MLLHYEHDVVFFTCLFASNFCLPHLRSFSILNVSSSVCGEGAGVGVGVSHRS